MHLFWMYKSDFSWVMNCYSKVSKMYWCKGIRSQTCLYKCVRSRALPKKYFSCFYTAFLYLNTVTIETVIMKARCGWLNLHLVSKCLNIVFNIPPLKRTTAVLFHLKTMIYKTILSLPSELYSQYAGCQHVSV